MIASVLYSIGSSRTEAISLLDQFSKLLRCTLENGIGFFFRREALRTKRSSLKTAKSVGHIPPS